MYCRTFSALAVITTVCPISAQQKTNRVKCVVEYLQLHLTTCTTFVIQLKDCVVPRALQQVQQLGLRKVKNHARN